MRLLLAMAGLLISSSVSAQSQEADIDEAKFAEAVGDRIDGARTCGWIGDMGTLPVEYERWAKSHTMMGRSVYADQMAKREIERKMAMSGASAAQISSACARIDRSGMRKLSVQKARQEWAFVQARHRNHRR